MSEVKLVVRDTSRDLSMTCHGSDAQRVVAALSADPVTLEELEVALQRFQNPNSCKFLSAATEELDYEPWDAGLVVVDLVARLIVIDSSYFFCGHSGQVYFQNGEYRTNIAVGYCLADDWKILGPKESWQALAESRRKERLSRPRVDVRAILYGRPMLEFVAQECWAALPRVMESLAQENDAYDEDVSQNHSPSYTQYRLPLTDATEDGGDRSVVYDALKEIHARWLMTTRDDLGQKSPREVLLAQREHLSLDMQQRCDQWARTQECPRGLDATSHAFRFGGFGTHELVKYYDLVRELLWSCWNRLTDLQSDNATPCRDSSGARRFLEKEVLRLEQFRDDWLNTPDPECHLRTPQSVIDRERARLPEAVFGRDAMIDPDCPCCQMLADLPGPTFWHLDGSGMDWEFAFDIHHRTREEWDAEQNEFAEFAKDQLERNPNAEDSAPGNAVFASSVWTRSFSLAESTNLPIGVRLLGIAWHVAELVMELNEVKDSGCLIDELNRDFRNLREVISGTEEASSMESLVDPVVDRFDQTLVSIAAEHLELEPRCSDLARKVQSFREPPSYESTSEFPDSGASS